MNLDASSSSIEDLANLLNAGIAAAKAGDEAQARTLLRRAAEQDERNVKAWLWLSSVVDNFADLEVCLENAAVLQPDNELICQRLAWVKQQQAARLPPSAEPSAVKEIRQAA